MADIYERTPGKWYLRARIDGRRIHRLAGLSKSEATAVLKQFKRDRAVRSKKSFDDPLFPDLCAEYLESAQVRLAPRTITGYIRAINAYWIKSLVNLHVSEIDSVTITDALSGMIRRGIKPSSVNQSWRVLRTILNYAKDRGHVPHVPTIRHVKEYDREFPSITMQDIENYLERANPDLRDFASIMIHTGLRVSELLDLEWRDIDMDAQQITVRSNLSLKSSSGGMIPFGDAVKSILSQRRNRTGPFSALTYDRIKWFHRKMKVKFRLYDFRHLFCTHLLEAGVDPATVSKLMRHDIQMTMKVYHHLRIDHARDAISRLPKITHSAPNRKPRPVT